VKPSDRTGAVKAAIVLLAIAVLLCLALSSMVMGASHGSPHVALVCCFILAVMLVGLAVVRRPTAQHLSRAPALKFDRYLQRSLVPLARAPDPIDLGALLI